MEYRSDGGSLEEGSHNTKRAGGPGPREPQPLAARMQLFGACNETGSHPSDYANRSPREEKSENGKERNQEMQPC